MNKKSRVSAGTALLLTAVLASPAVASADELPPASTVEDVISSAPGADRVLDAPARVDDLSVSVSANDGAISFSDADGSALVMGLPNNAVFTEDLSSGLGDETVVTAQYTDAQRATNAGVEAISGRAVLVIPKADAASSYAFDMQLPEDVTARQREDGGLDLVRAAVNVEAPDTEVETVVGEILPAWAVDANGVSIPTTYSLSGSTLTQTIDFSAVTAFPVVADPEVKWMGYFVRLTYSKAETLNMRDSGVVIAGIVGSAAAIGAVAGPASVAIIAAVWAASAVAVGSISATASNAVGDGKCLQVDIPSMYPSIVKCRS